MRIQFSTYRREIQDTSCPLHKDIYWYTPETKERIVVGRILRTYIDVYEVYFDRRPFQLQNNSLVPEDLIHMKTFVSYLESQIYAKQHFKDVESLNKELSLLQVQIAIKQ